ncbi:MAG TPA: SRPBCC family protein [Thermoanaerobaculia bacterium]
MPNIEKKILINAPLDAVFAFATDPQRWNDFFVGLTVPDEVNGTGKPGTIVKQHYLLAGFTFPVTTRVLVNDFGPKQATWKAAIDGPLAGTQEWLYTAKGNTTEILTKIDYTVPAKALGKITDHLVIEKMEERAFEHTLENLKLLCETKVPATV